tara:strand:+ start:247 stop:384 length:138 start_codon:yes stop_codon:yes gene_type:complete
MQKKDESEETTSKGWRFIYWDDLGDTQNEVDNQKKDTFAKDEQDT